MLLKEKVNQNMMKSLEVATQSSISPKPFIILETRPFVYLLAFQWSLGCKVMSMMGNTRFLAKSWSDLAWLDEVFEWGIAREFNLNFISIEFKLRLSCHQFHFCPIGLRSPCYRVNEKNANYREECMIIRFGLFYLAIYLSPMPNYQLSQT